MPFLQHNTATAARVPRPAVPARSGVSLMEVLIAIFVVSIGLLGIAALIPVANFALVETGKADRSAACGQAAMRDVRVRRLIELVDDSKLPFLLQGNTIAADPLLFARGYNRPTLGAVLQRSHLYTQGRLQGMGSAPMSLGEASGVFHWHDDLLFDMLEGTTLRPRGFDLNNNGTLDGPLPEQSYSWFFTVSPSAADDAAAHTLGWQGRKRFTVSVVVCYQREFDVPERSENISGVLGVKSGTGELRGVISGINVPSRPDLEPGQWVLLRGTRQNYATGNANIHAAEWYRIAAGSGEYFAVDGPYWPSGQGPTELVVVPGVLGVYTTSFELDRGPEWLR